MRGAVEKQPTASKTKGVVGQIGKNSPIAPIPRKINPNATKIIVLNCKKSPD